MAGPPTTSQTMGTRHQIGPARVWEFELDIMAPEMVGAASWLPGDHQWVKALK
jgi:hypothetical protein